MVKRGYKQTEVGVIPEDWEAKPLGDQLTLQRGFDLPSRLRREGSVPIVSSSGITASHSEARVSAPGIVTGRYGTVGQVFFIEQDFWPLNTTLYVKDFKGNDPLYLSYLLRTVDFASHSGKSGVPGINRNDIHELLSAVPKVPEQQAIASALSDVDGLLGALDRLITKKRDLKQAAMQQLLTGQTRLPEFETDGDYQESEVSVVPADWRVVKLNSLIDPARSIRYGIVQPGKYDPNGRFMIRGQDYSEAKGWAKPSDVFRVSDEVELRYRNARVQQGDLIMTIVGYCGHVEVVPEWLDGANLTQTTARIAIRSDLADSLFCKYQLQSVVGTRQVASYLKGAAQPGLNCGDVEQFLLCLPELPEQTAIAKILNDMDADLAALEQRRDKTRASKQGMMQELLTGRTRLVNTDGTLKGEQVCSTTA